MPKFSIIIPCYNSFKLMDKCLESLENQTYKDFETIIIDDVSTDDSFEKLSQYKENSELNIILLKNEKNIGPGGSRNNGISNASGKYITFIDSDDYIENNALETLNRIFDEKKADCIIYDYYFRTQNNIVKRKSLLKGEEGFVTKSDALIYSTGTTCGKAYLLENIKNNNIQFPDLKRNEDMPFNKLAMSVCNHIYYCNKPLYNYTDNQESLMHNKKLLNEQNAMNAFNIIESNLREKYSNEVEAIFLKEYLYATTMTLVKKGAKSKDIKNHIENCVKKYPNVYQNESIKYMTKYQKMCIKAIKLKSVIILKVLINLKEFVKKII